MGGGNVRQSKIKENELEELIRMTKFNKDLVQTFYQFFRRFSSLSKEDGLIDYDEFLEIIHQNDNSFSSHLFLAFDQNCNKNINFREFIKFYSVFQSGNADVKTKVSFKLFSEPKTKIIDREQMFNILTDGVNGNGVLSKHITREEINNIVQTSFDNYQNILRIDYKTYLNRKFQFQNTEELEENKSSSCINHTFNHSSLVPYSANHSRIVGREGTENNNMKQGSSNTIEINIEKEGFNFNDYSIIFSNKKSITEWMYINTKKLKSFVKTVSRGVSCF